MELFIAKRTVNWLPEGITIDELRTLCNERKIKWTTHIAARLQERGIDPSNVKHCIQTGEIIEQYPEDYPHPSCLVLGLTIGEKRLHAVIGLGGGYIWLVTAYYPDTQKWEDDFKTRKAVQ